MDEVRELAPAWPYLGALIPVDTPKGFAAGTDVGHRGSDTDPYIMWKLPCKSA